MDHDGGDSGAAETAVADGGLFERREVVEPRQVLVFVAPKLARAGAAGLWPTRAMRTCGTNFHHGLKGERVKRVKGNPMWPPGKRETVTRKQAAHTKAEVRSREAVQVRKHRAEIAAVDAEPGRERSEILVDGRGRNPAPVSVSSGR